MISIQDKKNRPARDAASIRGDQSPYWGTVAGCGSLCLRTLSCTRFLLSPETASAATVDDTLDRSAHNCTLVVSTMVGDTLASSGRVPTPLTSLQPGEVLYDCGGRVGDAAGGAMIEPEAAVKSLAPLYHNKSRQTIPRIIHQTTRKAMVRTLSNLHFIYRRHDDVKSDYQWPQSHVGALGYICVNSEIITKFSNF